MMDREGEREGDKKNNTTRQSKEDTSSLTREVGLKQLI